MLRESVTMEGHLTDSDLLRLAFAKIVELAGEFEVLEFRVGKTSAEASLARLAVMTPEREVPDRILDALNYLGASTVVEDTRFAAADAKGILPVDFYSTTSLDTFVRIGGALESVRQRMDCASPSVIDPRDA